MRWLRPSTRACSSGVRIAADAFVREMSFGLEYQAIGSDMLPIPVWSNGFTLASSSRTTNA